MHWYPWSDNWIDKWSNIILEWVPYLHDRILTTYHRCSAWWYGNSKYFEYLTIVMKVIIFLGMLIFLIWKYWNQRDVRHIDGAELILRGDDIDYRLIIVIPGWEDRDQESNLQYSSTYLLEGMYEYYAKLIGNGNPEPLNYFFDKRSNCFYRGTNPEETDEDRGERNDRIGEIDNDLRSLNLGKPLFSLIDILDFETYILELRYEGDIGSRRDLLLARKQVDWWVKTFRLYNEGNADKRDTFAMIELLSYTWEILNAMLSDPVYTESMNTSRKEITYNGNNPLVNGEYDSNIYLPLDEIDHGNAINNPENHSDPYLETHFLIPNNDDNAYGDC